MEPVWCRNVLLRRDRRMANVTAQPPSEGTCFRIGDFAQVRITEAREHELVGEVVG